MKNRVYIACVALVLLISGCGTHKTESIPSATSTTSPSATSETTTSPTTTITTTLPSLSTPSASESNTTTTPSVATDSSSVATATQATVTSTVSTATTQHSSTPISSTPIQTSPSTTTSTVLPEDITFKATIRENVKNQTVSGVRVTVYVNDSDTPGGSGVTDNKGVVRITLKKGNSYRVELSNLPSGYESNAFYAFSTTTVNITIRKAAVQNEKDHSGAQYEEGRKMTDFSLTDIDGNTYRLSTLLTQKQLIVLDFWYTTCEPCKMEFPYFEAATQKYGDRFSLLAVNPINDKQAMVNLRQQLNASPKTAVSFPMLKDTCNLYLGFAVSAYPTTVFIDSNGVIVDIHLGAYTSEKEFLAAIERYLH